MWASEEVESARVEKESSMEEEKEEKEKKKN